jgi:hypothetical protein
MATVTDVLFLYLPKHNFLRPFGKNRHIVEMLYPRYSLHTFGVLYCVWTGDASRTIGWVGPSSASKENSGRAARNQSSAQTKRSCEDLLLGEGYRLHGGGFIPHERTRIISITAIKPNVTGQCFANLPKIREPPWRISAWLWSFVMFRNPIG